TASATRRNMILLRDFIRDSPCEYEDQSRTSQGQRTTCPPPKGERKTSQSQLRRKGLAPEWPPEAKDPDQPNSSPLRSEGKHLKASRSKDPVVKRAVVQRQGGHDGKESVFG